MALYILIWHDFLNTLSEKEQGVMVWYHGGRGTERKTHVYKGTVYTEPQKPETIAISGEVRVGGRLIFLHMPCWTPGIFSPKYLRSFLNRSKILYRPPSESLKGCGCASVEPGHCLPNCRGNSTWPHTTSNDLSKVQSTHVPDLL